jgi:serine/threonine protein kinase
LLHPYGGPRLQSGREHTSTLASHKSVYRQARYFFQQLVAGLEYCHTKVCCSAGQAAISIGCMFASLKQCVPVALCVCRAAVHCEPLKYTGTFVHWHVQGVCHRDLKLENVLLAGKHAPLVKICDFGYSKVLHPTQLLICLGLIGRCLL